MREVLRQINQKSQAVEFLRNLYREKASIPESVEAICMVPHKVLRLVLSEADASSQMDRLEQIVLDELQSIQSELHCLTRNEVALRLSALKYKIKDARSADLIASEKS